jgi:Na+-translocating ferredoxin:NAD+ oxidoreductase RNF subunit RnfB
VSGGVRVQDARCRGCANCIKSCPTEALRVIEGLVRIIPELCIDCGECVRVCREKAIQLYEDEWNVLRAQKNLVLMADPTFYVQVGAYARPALMKEALQSSGIEDLTEYESEAYDIAACSIAKLLDTESRDRLPFISTYCPAVLRLIQINFPELVGRIVPVESPLEIGVALWKNRTGRDDPVTMAVPCPAKTTLVHAPEGRERSTMTYSISVRRLVRDILAGSPKVAGALPTQLNRRWLLWSVSGGECRHVESFSERQLTTISVSGLRNTKDLLTELELGRLSGVDYIECRACDLGCIGGVGTSESRFLSQLRLDSIKIDWNPTEDERRVAADGFASDIWKLEKPVRPKQRLPLAENLKEAMDRLRTMNAIFSELPHIDCGSCGRPSCRAMAEDIVRGHGETTDCIFKLRERIFSLSAEIHSLSGKIPHTFRSQVIHDHEDQRFI